MKSPKGGFAPLTSGGFLPRSKGVSHIIRVPVANLRPNPFQVRKDFDSARALHALHELRDSIQEHGLQTPIHVQRDPDDQTAERFIIVAGERRWRAIQLLGEQFIEAKIVEGDPETLALIENIQRSDLNPVEEAEAYVHIMQRNGLNQTTLAKAIGKSRPSVNDMVKIAALPEIIKQEYQCSDEPPSKSALIELAKIDNPEEQIAIWRGLQNKGKIKIQEARKQRRGTLDQTEAFKSTMLAAKRFIEKLETIEHAAPENIDELMALRDAIDRKINLLR
ncbi:MAG: ParB/RepB/Spo0J family partition protein [Gammaproteobacteria bacterium]|nr:ParB/RepB/Spo0J family partition protein [Gammaproteobacteria bacterium]